MQAQKDVCCFDLIGIETSYDLFTIDMIWHSRDNLNRSRAGYHLYLECSNLDSLFSTTTSLSRLDTVNHIIPYWSVRHICYAITQFCIHKRHPYSHPSNEQTTSKKCKDIINLSSLSIQSVTKRGKIMENFQKHNLLNANPMHEPVLLPRMIERVIINDLLDGCHSLGHTIAILAFNS
jgi:hypothetical protein